MNETGQGVPEICSTLLKIDLFSFLPEDELNSLANRFTMFRAPKGSILCAEGESGDTLMIIKTGLVRVSVNKNGQEQVLAELKRGDFFGERALLTGEPRSATATAALDVELFELKKGDFDQLLLTSPQFAYHISRTVSSRQLADNQSGLQRRSACYFSIIPSHPDLGCQQFAVNLASAAAAESGKNILLVDMQEERGGLTSALHAKRSKCPDRRLLEEFPNEEQRQAIAESWYAADSGISVFELPLANNRALAAELIRRASPLMELLKNSFRLVLFVLPHELTPLCRRILQLSDGVLFMISNSDQHSAEVERKYTLIRSITSPLSVQIKVGTSHKPAGKGIYRRDIRQQLNLAEMPQIWFSDNEEKMGKSISGLSREICSRRIGLALGAGASRGWAHLGVLRALEKNGIPIDMIAGSSIGAFVGALYAKTGSAEAAIDLAFSTFSDYRQIKKNIFDYSLLTGGGILKGNRILAVLQEMLDDADFFDLKIPLSVVAVDMATGMEVIIEEGSVSKAVRASISSPGIFRPFQMDGRWYTDGALINPLPVDIIINKGANLVLASVVEKGVSDQWPGDKGPSILNTLSRSFSIMFARTARDRAQDADITIYPEVGGYTWGDFHLGKELVKKGEEACWQKMNEIEKMLIMKA